MIETNEYRHKLAQLDAEIASALAEPDREAETGRMVATPTLVPNLEPWGDDIAAPTEDSEPEEWPQPEPLPETLPPVPSFDPDLLPEALRPWVLDIAHRMQCPPDFPAVGALVALSSLIGARAVMAPKALDDWRVVPNLWGVVVGRPAVMKSPALSQTLSPLFRLEALELESWKAAHESWELDKRVADMAAAENERKAKSLAAKDPAAARALLQMAAGSEAPKPRRFVVNDASVEKLGELLQGNPWGFLAYRDEVYGLLKSLEKEGQEGARAFFLQAYDGNQGYTFDRIGRGTVHIPRVCMALLGSIQPSRMHEYVRGAVSGGTGDDGLIQRFGLTVWPDVDRGFRYVDQWPDTPAKQAAWAVFERLAALQPHSDSDPAVWRFSADAQELFAAWMTESKTELRGEEMHPALVSHLDKYSKLVPALALLFALVDRPDCACVVHEQELSRALAWSEFLRLHAHRVYSAATTPETSGAAALLSKIKAGKLVDGSGVMLRAFTPRQVAVKHWAGLDKPEDVRKAAALLADYGWLSACAVRRGGPAGGRSSEYFRINPVALPRG